MTTKTYTSRYLTKFATQVFRPSYQDKTLDKSGPHTIPTTHTMKMHPLYKASLTLIISQLFSFSAQAANLAPKVDGQNLTISHDKPTLLQSIHIEDDGNGKIKAILEVPEGFELGALPNGNVSVNTRSKHALELEGTVKNLNNYFSSKSTSPSVKSNTEKPESATLKITVQDSGTGNSKSGFIPLPDIGGNAGINRAPEGWQLNTHTPDVITGNGPWPGGNYEILDVDGGPSPFGGNMGLFLERADGSTPAESWKTKISGLTKSEKYTLRFAWQQSTVKKADGSGAKYSGGQLLVVIDGKEHVFTSTGNVNSDGWQTADIEFTAQGNSVEVSVGVKSNTANADGESIVVDAGAVKLTTNGEIALNVITPTAETKAIASKSESKPTEVKAVEKTVAEKVVNKKTKASDTTENNRNTGGAPLTTSATTVSAATTTASATSSLVSSGRITSSTGSIPEPSIDIIPSAVNTTNVGDVAITGSCISGATVSLSCFPNKNPAQTLSPAPSTTCSTSNAYSLTVNLTSLSDDTISCSAQQSIGSDTSAQSNKDAITKTTANMSVANVVSLEAPVVGVNYKQIITCTNNGISTAENAYCSVSGLPSWASTNCSATTSNVKPGDSIRCEIAGVPNNASPINANTTTGASNDDVASNNTGKLSSSLGTLPSPTLEKLASNINAKESVAVSVAGSCIPNATVSFSCSSNHASYNQLSTIPTVACNAEGKFASRINVSALDDGTVACSAHQTLGNVMSASSNVSTATKATARMSVPAAISLAAPIVGTPYNQSISCTNNGATAATNATCSISGLPNWANTTCAPTPPTLVPVGGSIVCKITGIPTTATPISATISTSASNNER